MSDLKLGQIKDIALSLYKDNAADPGKASEHFLTECWTQAVIKELNRTGFTNILIKRDHEHLISQNIKVEEEQ